MKEDKNLPEEIVNDNDQSEIIKYFTNEENELNKAIQEIDDLYDEVKEHYDQLKIASRSANGGRGILTFIQNQTGNLVALKNSKASLINNKITMKKYAAELSLKQKKDQDSANVSNDIINAIMEKLEKDNEGVIIEQEDYHSNSNESEEDLLDKRLKQLIDDGEIEEDESNIDNAILAIGIRDKKWHFIGIDEFGKIVKGYPVPDKSQYKIHLEKESDGTTIAIDQDDRIYKVVKLKSKKKKSK